MGIQFRYPVRNLDRFIIQLDHLPHYCSNWIISNLDEVRMLHPSFNYQIEIMHGNSIQIPCQKSGQVHYPTGSLTTLLFKLDNWITSNLDEVRMLHPSLLIIKQRLCMGIQFRYPVRNWIGSLSYFVTCVNTSTTHHNSANSQQAFIFFIFLSFMEFQVEKLSFYDSEVDVSCYMFRAATTTNTSDIFVCIDDREHFCFKIFICISPVFSGK